MGSLDDATSDNTTQETTLATIRSISGDWDNSAVNVTAVSGISAIANTNSSEGQGSYSYDGGQETLNKYVLQGNYFGQTISYSEGTLTLARETYVFTVCDCDG